MPFMRGHWFTISSIPEMETNVPGIDRHGRMTLSISIIGMLMASAVREKPPFGGKDLIYH